MAQFPNEVPTTDRGSVRLTINGTAEVSDDCKTSGDQNFTATYDGQLIVQPDGRYNANLYPAQLMLADGCHATAIRQIDQIANIQLGAQLGDQVGLGSLTYQNLSAVDGDELQAGAFDELAGDLTFTKQ